jgi:hypothetical protein
VAGKAGGNEGKAELIRKSRARTGNFDKSGIVALIYLEQRHGSIFDSGSCQAQAGNDADNR